MYKEKLKHDLDTILDLFSGADGGIGFVMFNAHIHDLALKLDNNTLNEKELDSAKEILQIIGRFRRLVDLLSKK